MVLNFESLLKKYKMNIRGIIHVGGHHGWEAQTYLRFGIPQVIFFEPLSYNYSQLIKNIGSYKAVQCGLGSHEHSAEMYVEFDNSCQSSSLMAPARHLDFYPHIHFPAREIVNIKCLDSFELTDYNMLSLDVQGYELEVLKGAAETLSHVDYIICEVNLVEHYSGSPLIYDIDTHLADFVRLDTHLFPEQWGDAFYMRKTTLSAL